MSERVADAAFQVKYHAPRKLDNGVEVVLSPGRSNNDIIKKWLLWRGLTAEL